MSAVTGTSTDRATRKMAANISSAGVCSPSGQPRAAETPLLVVATAGKPASATARALAASHTFGKTSGSGPACKARSCSAALARPSRPGVSSLMWSALRLVAGRLHYHQGARYHIVQCLLFGREPRHQEPDKQRRYRQYLEQVAAQRTSV